MSSASGTAVMATFGLATYTLSTTRSGTLGGTVTGPGIACPSDCSEPVPYGRTITLTATGDATSTFAGWSGACTGLGTCTFTVAGDTTVNAAFAVKQYPLSVAITKLGTATGTVSSTPAGINCGATCTALYGVGSTVVLGATPAAGMVFGGWSGACKGLGNCIVSVNQATNVTANFAESPNLVFVTSTTHTGALGGLAGADAICQSRATAAGLTGTYRAWLSTMGTTAISRLGNASGWVRRDGLPVFNTKADVAAGRVQYLPVLTEQGTELTNPFILTGTGVDGTFSGVGHGCTSWTIADSSPASAGRARISDAQFSSYTTVNCLTPLPLYCFGIDRQGAAAVTPTPNRRTAFVSNASFAAPVGGLAAADAVCTAEATAAGLGGTYKALLATNAATGASRFLASGYPWARVDGVTLASTAAAFLSGAQWDTGLNLSASGGLSVPNSLVWGGASTPSASGTAATTCASWTGGTNGAAGISGKSAVAEAFGDMPRACALTTPAVRLYCLQE